MSKDSKITLETTIQFSLKMLLSLLGGMLVLFFGFYGLVVAPKQIEQDDRLDKQETEMKEQNRLTNQQLMEINNGIGTLNGTVEGINSRFGDLRNLRDDDANTSGGFSN